MNGIEELREYLAENKEEFHQEWGGGHDDVLQTEFNKFIRGGKTAKQFYTESKILLYFLTWFGEDQWKKPYRRVVAENFLPTTAILEDSCGVGTDGLEFLDKGFPVQFMDFEGECSKFLEWRLAKRGKKDKVHGFDEPLKVDLVLAFSTLEHSKDARQTISKIEKLGKFVAMNFMSSVGEPVDGKEHLHYHHDADELISFVKSHSEIIQERDFNYARFLIYKPNEQIALPKARRQVPVVEYKEEQNNVGIKIDS